MRLHKKSFRFMFSSLLCLMMSIYYVNVFLVFGAASTKLTLSIISGDDSKTNTWNSITNDWKNSAISSTITAKATAKAKQTAKKTNTSLSDFSNIYAKISNNYISAPLVWSYFWHNAATTLGTATASATNPVALSGSNTLNNKNSSNSSINKESKTEVVTTVKKAQNIVHISENKELKAANKTSDSQTNVSKYLTGSISSIKSLIMKKSSLVKIIVTTLFAYF